MRMTGAGTHDRLKLRIVAAFAAIYLIWGSTYLAIRIGIETIPPLLMAGIRFTSAGGLLYAWARRRSGERLSLVHWRSAAIIGVALLCISNGGITWSEQRIPSGITALMAATVPLWIVVMEWLFHGGARPRRGVAAGLILGFVGIFLLVGPDQIFGRKALDLGSIGVLMVAAISWANGSLYSRRAVLPGSQLLATSMEMLAGGAALFVVSLVSGETSHVQLAAISLRSWLAVGYLALFGSIIGFTAYVWLLRVTAVSRVATYAYVNPVIAIMLGWAFAGEQLNSHVVAAAGVIVLAVVLIIRSQPGTKKQADGFAREIPHRPVVEKEFVGK